MKINNFQNKNFVIPETTVYNMKKAILVHSRLIIKNHSKLLKQLTYSHIASYL